MSIWNFTNRAAFEKDLAAFPPKYVAARPSGRPFEMPVSGQPHQRDKLPPCTEKQLADDFAFLAAWQPFPACVSAATVTLDKDSGTFRLNVAANEGIKAPIEAALRDLVVNLRGCASLSLSRDMCASQCLDGLADAHRNRILGRLGSPKFKQPKDCPQKRIVRIGPRVKDMAIKAVRLRAPERGVGDASLFVNQIRDLSAAVDAIDKPGVSVTTSRLVAVIKAAYAVTIDGVSVARRLRDLGYNSDTVERREFRQIYALGNYWRICLELATVSRSYRSLFSTLEICVVRHCVPEYWPSGSRVKHFVHAEVQLLVHHETAAGLERPGYIGTSKKACFLCHSFIQAHGMYRTQESHGEVYTEWTVPDKSDYAAETRAALGRALQRTAADVKQALKKSKKAPLRLAPHVQQSLVNVNLNTLRTPSASTLRSSIASKENIQADFNAGSEPRQTVQRFDSHQATSRKSAVHEDGSQDANNMFGRTLPTSKDVVMPGRSTEVRLGTEVTLFVSLESPDVGHQYTSASCRVLPSSEIICTVVQAVEITKLALGEEVVLETAAGVRELPLVLVAGGSRSFIVHFGWHRYAGTPSPKLM